MRKLYTTGEPARRTVGRAGSLEKLMKARGHLARPKPGASKTVGPRAGGFLLPEKLACGKRQAQFLGLC